MVRFSFALYAYVRNIGKYVEISFRDELPLVLYIKNCNYDITNILIFFSVLLGKLFRFLTAKYVRGLIINVFIMGYMQTL